MAKCAICEKAAHFGIKEEAFWRSQESHLMVKLLI